MNKLELLSLQFPHPLIFILLLSLSLSLLLSLSPSPIIAILFSFKQQYQIFLFFSFLFFFYKSFTATFPFIFRLEIYTYKDAQSIFRGRRTNQKMLAFNFGPISDKITVISPIFIPLRTNLACQIIFPKLGGDRTGLHYGSGLNE